MEISTSTTKKGRINILTDGEYQFTVPAFIWYRSPLFGQTEADGVSLEALRAEGQAYDAYEKGLRLLGLRAHGTEELRRKLRRDYPADVFFAADLPALGFRLTESAVFAKHLTFPVG